MENIVFNQENYEQDLAYLLLDALVHSGTISIDSKEKLLKKVMKEDQVNGFYKKKPTG